MSYTPNSLEFRICDDEDCEHCMGVKDARFPVLSLPRFPEPKLGAGGLPEHYATYLQHKEGLVTEGAMMLAEDEHVHKCEGCDNYVQLTAGALKAHFRVVHGRKTRKTKAGRKTRRAQDAQDAAKRKRRLRGETRDDPVRKKRKVGREVPIDVSSSADSDESSSESGSESGSADSSTSSAGRPVLKLISGLIILKAKFIFLY